MIDAIFSQPNYLAAKKMLDAAAMRSEAIASNIANLETPGYKRLDINPSFNSELQRATAAGDTERLASVKPSLSPDPNAVAQSNDGNTVNLETELMQQSQNFLQHTLETHLITASLLKVRLAITGRAG